MNSALLILRLVIGLGIAAHGAQKLFGCFGGGGINGTGTFLEGIGFTPGSRLAVVAGLGEFLGGLLLAFGFLTHRRARGVPFSIELCGTGHKHAPRYF